MVERFLVYRNLTRKVWSLKNPITRKVERHGISVFVKGCTFIVSEATRQRVIREKKKYVHAYVRGELVETVPTNKRVRPLKYNPYLYGHFYDGDTLEPVYSAEFVVFDASGKCWYCPQD
jgi:hypothetical protein